jgi:beta-lactam-binding protein with PASTA domain
MLSKIKSFVLSKRFAINLGVLILFYILLFFGVKGCMKYKTNFGEKIEVPNLIGKNQNNLKNIMADSPLIVEVLDSIYDPTKVVGTILEQDPMPTSSSKIFVKEGRVIRVRVSKRTRLIEVPNLINKSQRFAEGILRNRSFKYKLEYQPSQESNGAVIKQLYKGKPVAEGTKIPIGSTILIVVGRNEVGIPVELPNLQGMSIVEAKGRVNAMLNMDFLVVCPDCVTSADSSMARVQSQSPEFSEGAIISSGGSITIYATKSPIENDN